MNPLVSVIIPTHNRQDFLVEAIESILQQQYPSVELIVVDDGSTDNTRAVVAAYPSVSYEYQENKGPGAARNRGIVRAAGTLICFLDSDDLWDPEKLAVQVSYMKTTEDCMISYTNEQWIRNGRQVNQKKKHRKYSGNIFNRCVPLCIISPSSVMIRREVFDRVGLFDETLPVCEDYDLWLRIAARYAVHFIDRNLIIKRGGHPDQLSHRFWGNDRFRVRALEKAIRDPVLTPADRLCALEELIRKASILEQGFRKRSKTAEADYYQNLIEYYRTWNQ